MTFPTTALPVKAQWYVNGAWTDLTRPTDPAILGADGGSRVFGIGRGDVVIKRGRADETRDVDAGSCSCTAWNNDGALTPWNPSGSFYGAFGLNTPFRVGVTSDDAWLRFAGPDFGSEGLTPSAGARVTAPDSAATSITGDLDVRLNADLDTWAPRVGKGVDLIGKWTSTAGQKSWELVLQAGASPGGWIGFYWSADGTTELGALATVPLPVTTGRLSVRATIDVNNGAAGKTVTFYYSYDTDLSAASWTQLGDAVTTSGTTSIFNSTTENTIGDTATGSQARTIRGKVYTAQVRNGIAGSIVANPDFTAQTAGAGSFADTAAAPNTWTLTGGASIEDTDWRFHGEVPEWRPRRDTSGNDNYVPIDARGILTRLGIGNQPLQSPMRKSLSARDDTVAYWPMEDGRDATRFGSALTTGRVLRWAETDPNLASDSQFICSKPLPQMNGGRVTGVVAPYTHTGTICLQFLMYVPAATADLTLLARLNTSSNRWDIRYGDVAGGSLRLEWYDSDGVKISETAFITFAVDNDLRWVSLELTQNGANVDYQLATLQVGRSTGTATSGSAVMGNMGRATVFRTGHQGADPDAVFGHVIINTSIRSIYDVYQQLNAFIGETAGRRIERLCQENGVQFTALGDMDQTVTMGAQGVAAFLALVREAANTDHGILHEPRDREGIAYRSRESLTRQRTHLELSYTGNDLSLYEPASTTATLQNEVTVSRGGVGSSVAGGDSTISLDEGPLSVAEPPDGVGHGYAGSYTLNVEDDTVLDDHAAWLVHVGTVNQPRIERAAVALERASGFADDAARAVARGVDVGDVITITDLPEQIGSPDDLLQLVQGTSETLHQRTHTIEWSVSPASPYAVAVYDDPAGDGITARYSSDGTVLAEVLDTTETGIDISTPAGPQWTTDPAEYPFDIRVGGERITVGGCTTTGATTQTFTGCTRSVNGVVATHAIGDDVELWDVTYWDL